MSWRGQSTGTLPSTLRHASAASQLDASTGVQMIGPDVRVPSITKDLSKQCLGVRWFGFTFGETLWPIEFNESNEWVGLFRHVGRAK